MQMFNIHLLISGSFSGNSENHHQRQNDGKDGKTATQ
jgi:hypothetical protein